MKNNEVSLYETENGQYNKLDRDSTFAKFATVQDEGTRKFQRTVKYFN